MQWNATKKQHALSLRLSDGRKPSDAKYLLASDTMLNLTVNLSISDFSLYISNTHNIFSIITYFFDKLQNNNKKKPFQKYNRKYYSALMCYWTCLKPFS